MAGLQRCDKVPRLTDSEGSGRPRPGPAGPTLPTIAEAPTARVTAMDQRTIRQNTADAVRRMAHYIEMGQTYTMRIESFVEVSEGRDAIISLEIPYEAVASPENGSYGR